MSENEHLESEKIINSEINEQNIQNENLLENLNVQELIEESEKIVKNDNFGKEIGKFISIKKKINDIFINSSTENTPELDKSISKFKEIEIIFNEKLYIFNKNQEHNQKENLQKKLDIIDRLKNLYTNSTSDINYFKEIRKIKEDWTNCGQVSKSEFKTLNNNYFHHLNQFYKLLDYNKEYRELEFAHNLEKRKSILKRSAELLEEPSVQKALNELQYLHKLWKEEAEPVAEEHKETTWQEFISLSNKIHDRKADLMQEMDLKKNENFNKKKIIIQEIRKIINNGVNNQSYWNLALKKVDDLRNEFLKIGSLPKKESQQNWNDYRNVLKDFNHAKNTFFKSIRNIQITNLEAKKALIKIAQDNMLSEDWDTTTQLFKKLQSDWSKIGHVPRSQSNILWDEFKLACNTFFENFRQKTDALNNDWKENFVKKEAILEQLKNIQNSDEDVEKINQLKNDWNAIGKVPKEHMGINSIFNKVLKEKLKLNKINEYDLVDNHLSENQITEKARKIKNEISDLESEVAKLENNLSFFKNPSEDNPLLKDTFIKIKDKKSEIKSLKDSLHRIITENQS